MEDVDLLLPPGSLEGARACLESRGFRLHDAGFPAPTTLPLLAPDGLSVDLHTQLLNPRIPLWRELTREVEGSFWDLREAGALSPEAEFLLVAVHGSKHWWVRDRWLLDLALLWGSPPRVDPQALLHLARGLGMGPLLRVPLAFLRQGPGLEVPASPLDGLGSPTPAEATLLDQLTRGERDYRDLRLRRFLPMLPDHWARLRVLRDTLLPSPREARERFGATSYPRFLLGRLLRALGRPGSEPDAAPPGLDLAPPGPGAPPSGPGEAPPDTDPAPQAPRPPGSTGSP